MEESWYFLESEAKGRFVRRMTEAERYRLLRSFKGQGKTNGLNALWSRLSARLGWSNGGDRADRGSRPSAPVESRPQEQCC